MLNDVITQMVDYVTGIAHCKRESARPIHAFWYEQEIERNFADSRHYFENLLQFCKMLVVQLPGMLVFIGN